MKKENAYCWLLGFASAGNHSKAIMDEFTNYINLLMSEKNILPSIKISEYDNKNIESAKIPLEEIFAPYVCSGRLFNLIRNLSCDGVYTVGDLIKKGKKWLLRTPNFGVVSIREMDSILYRHGIIIPNIMAEEPKENIKEKN